MKFKDYYKILGVSESASQEEIKRAYRKKARLYHPDVSAEPGTEEKFKEVSEAYEALRDESRRAEYDQLKKYGYKGGDEFRGSGQWRNSGRYNSQPFGQGEFGDFFESIFGAGSFRQDGYAGTARKVLRGGDVRLTVQVALENAYIGGKIKLKVPAGRGIAPRTLNVSIPAGIVNGQQLRLRSQGHPGENGGASGDLVITVQLKPHPLFKVDGKDILLALPVTPYEAATGLSLSVPTLAGEVSMTIPAGTRSGTRMRLRGKGLSGKSAGDLIVKVQVLIPKNLSKAALNHLQRFDEEVNENPREHLFQSATHE